MAGKKQSKEDLLKGLPEKQKAFCREYVIDWNGSRAYKVAYPGVTDGTARTESCKLLTKPNIIEYCDLIKTDLEKLCGISKAQIINEHLKLVRNTIAGLQDTWIERKRYDALTEEQKACISEISTQVRKVTVNEETFTEVEFVKIKLYDKQKALDSLAKLMGYDSPQKLEVTSPLHVVLTKEETKKISEQLENDC